MNKYQIILQGVNGAIYPVIFECESFEDVELMVEATGIIPMDIGLIQEEQLIFLERENIH